MKLRTPPRRAYEHAICDQPSRTRRQFSLNHPAHPFEHVHRFDPTPRLRTNAQPVLSATIMVPMTLRSRLRLFEFSDLLTTTRLYRRTIYSTPAAQRRLPISGRRYFFLHASILGRKSIGDRLSAIAVLDAKLPTAEGAEANCVSPALAGRLWTSTSL
jgi:hypothetical protein